MKYLPWKYLKSQTHWFGNCGIPWHTSVVFKEHDEQIELLAFCHIFKSCTRGACGDCHRAAEVCNAADGHRLVSTGKCWMLPLRDQHCSRKLHQLPTRRCDAASQFFSNAQGGKGACDCKAATHKVHMRAYLNSNHDIESVDHMYDAMTSSAGIPSLSVSLCDSVTAWPLQDR